MMYMGGTRELDTGRIAICRYLVGQISVKLEFDRLQNDSKMSGMYKREIEKDIDSYLKGKDNKTLFVWGPRRSGKTTIMKKLAKQLGERLYNFDFVTDREPFVPRRTQLDQLVAKHKVILIDEVQNYPESTVVIKLLHDEYSVKVIATGSSELRQKSKVFDSLAGRYREVYCLPLTEYELAQNMDVHDERGVESIVGRATQIQKYGAYPEVLLSREDERIELLNNILNNYVLKDVLNIYELKDLKLAKDILTKIALQIGSEVSVREIAKSLTASPTTIANYIEIFVKNYILIPLPSFKTNVRRAVSENRKLYFLDLGIRNALIQDFRDLELRPDRGGVFENFVISEIEKARRVKKTLVNLYFYREYGGKEIDLIVEDYYKKYVTVEIKVGGGKMQKIFPLPNKQLMINSENYMDQIPKILGSK